LHHVYARGNGRQPIFLDDVDRRRYLTMLGEVAKLMGWRCLAYCLMGNHVHLLIETTEPNLGAGMHRLHMGYAKWFNERHGRDGHLFQGRFGSIRMKSEAQLRATVAYIARNPLEAGLCRRAEDWPWSGHRYVMRGEAPAWLDVDRLLSFFSSTGGDPRRAYVALTAAD
jgi:REP element-mobilizing transposase RayT